MARNIVKWGPMEKDKREEYGNRNKERKRKWTGDTLQKYSGAIGKEALDCNHEGVRKRGRPRNSWWKPVLARVERAGKTWTEVKVLEADRVEAIRRSPLLYWRACNRIARYKMGWKERNMCCTCLREYWEQSKVSSTYTNKDK